jgi:hypothetical protein
MRDIIVLKDKDGGTAVLTTASPQSHYGVPVLRIEGAKDIPERGIDYGPADLIAEVKGVPLRGAHIVAGWALGKGRTQAEIQIARQYLRQWPDGPQLPEIMPYLTCARCSHTWHRRTDKRPDHCPKCKSPYWDRPKKEEGK